MVVDNLTEESREMISTKELSFNDLIDRADNIQALCTDYTVPKANSMNVRFTDSGLTFVDSNKEVRHLSISRYAMCQLCTKIGVPSQYIEKCIKTGRQDLASENISSWLDSYNNDLFIRGYEDRIRGVLTPKFSCCDSPEILGVVNDVFGSDLKVRGSYISEERLHLRMSERTKLPIDGEDLFAGFTINSSDVGRSILSVNFLVYKQVCTNGLCITRSSGRLFEQKHIGVTAQTFKEELEKSLNNVPIIVAEIMKNIEKSRNSGKIVKDFEDKEEMDRLILHLRQSSARFSEESANKVVELFRSRVNDKDLSFNYENNTWGLANTITEVAQDYTLERRLELEKYAGVLVA